MPPLITRVKWSASDIPWGVSFDENSGIFSGTPDEEGEYTVPVTVQTIFGKDTKDVIIKIVNSGYVYILGHDAYSATNKTASHDLYGFYDVDIPKATKLESRVAGFAAFTQNNVYYNGITGVSSTINTTDPISTFTNNSVLKETTEAQYDLLSARKQLCVYLHFGEGGYTYYDCIYLTCKSDNKPSLKFSDYYTFDGSTPAKLINKGTLGLNVSSYTAFDIDETLGVLSRSMKNAAVKNSPLRWLSSDRTKIYDLLIYARAGNIKFIDVELKTTDLGYRAIKTFQSSIFTCLSEDHYLDNESANFTYGTIKNAWGLGTAIYVQTDSDELYSYSDGDWISQGKYDIKKLQVSYNGKRLFLLTNDGKLYHKGSSVIDSNISDNNGVVIDEHDNLTQIFPDYSFLDFSTYERGTARNATLVVIKK